MIKQEKFSNSLAETYSRALGLEIDVPFIYKSPYSLPFEDYIIIHNSSGNSSKNYDYFQDVIHFIKPYLGKIQIVQLGGKDDIVLDGCFNLCGRTTLHQSAFLIENAKLLIGNDSQLVHIAGALKTPVIGLYGPTSINCHGPYWHDKFIGIESHRNGKLPSYRFDENPKTINFIKIEDVVKSIFKMLDIKNYKYIFPSVHIGQKYNQKAIEVVLDQVIPPETLPNVPLNIRYDYLENPRALAQQLHLRKCLIITDKVIDLNILKTFKNNILLLVYKITENNDPNFALSVKRSGVPLKLVSNLNEEKLNQYKIDYFDVGLIEEEKVSSFDDIKEKKEINSETLFKTNKILLSNGKTYSSKIHWLTDCPRENMESPIINVPKFWEELDYFYVFNKIELTSL